MARSPRRNVRRSCRRRRWQCVLDGTVGMIARTPHRAPPATVPGAVSLGFAPHLCSAAFSVGSGLLAGVLLALALSRLLARWIEGSPRDPMVLLGVTLLLIAASTLACIVPARRASSVDPMVALRYE